MYMYINLVNRIGGVMLGVLCSNAVDRGFEPRSNQAKNYGVGICCFSVKHAALRRNSERAKTGWLGSESIMCPSVATCLSVDIYIYRILLNFNMLKTF